MMAAAPASSCVGVKPPVPETERDRVLSDAELKMIWEATDKIGQTFGPMIKLLILTARPRGEVAAMRWSELDLKRRKWMIRCERVKNDRPHEVPLSDAAIAVTIGHHGNPASRSVTNIALDPWPRVVRTGEKFVTRASSNFGERADETAGFAQLREATGILRRAG